MAVLHHVSACLAVCLCVSSVVAQQEEVEQLVETVPEHYAYMYQLESDEDAQQQYHSESRLWPAGDTLKVCFFGGNLVVRTLIARVASEWQNYVNLKLDFGAAGTWRTCSQPTSGFSQIRIGFGQKGYWSLIGSDSGTLANAYQPSMNFEGFDFRYNPFQPVSASQLFTAENVVASSRARDRSTVLHEFGHALGLLHEHQNPALGCQEEIRWTGPNNVYEHYGRPPNRWSRETVDRNLGPIAKIANAVAGEPDRESIMIYAQPAAIFIRGASSRCFVTEPTVLSTRDKQLVALLYPTDAPVVSDVAFSTPMPPVGLATDPGSRSAQGADRLERIRTDLNSDVASVRREARRQLALELQINPGALLAEVVAAAGASRNYRQQLGVLVAIDRAGTTPVLDAQQTVAVSDTLAQISADTEDDTLQNAVTGARAKLGL